MSGSCEFDYEAIGAKYKAVKHEKMTEAESNIWKRIQSLTHRFQNADRIVLGTPMWNFGLPYKLNHLTDPVAQRNLSVCLRRQQYGPLLNVEKAIVVYTRGFTFPGGYSYTAVVIRSPGNLFGLLVAACRCSRSSQRDS
jgi:FMN-dependent NADH-azoreductase